MKLTNIVGQSADGTMVVLSSTDGTHYAVNRNELYTHISGIPESKLHEMNIREIFNIRPYELGKMREFTSSTGYPPIPEGSSNELKQLLQNLYKLIDTPEPDPALRIKAQGRKIKKTLTESIQGLVGSFTKLQTDDAQKKVQETVQTKVQGIIDAIQSAIESAQNTLSTAKPSPEAEQQAQEAQKVQAVVDHARDVLFQDAVKEQIVLSTVKAMIAAGQVHDELYDAVLGLSEEQRDVVYSRFTQFLERNVVHFNGKTLFDAIQAGSLTWYSIVSDFI